MYNQRLRISMGWAVLLFSRSRCISSLKHQSWTPRQLEQNLLVYYQHPADFPFFFNAATAISTSTQTIGCNFHGCIVLSNFCRSAEKVLFFSKTFPRLVLDGCGSTLFLRSFVLHLLVCSLAVYFVMPISISSL